MSKEFELQDYGKTWPVSLHIGILAKDGITREKIVKKCDENSIETRVWSHGNLGRHYFWYKKYGIFKGKWSDEIYKRGFIVPTFPDLTKNDIDFISSVCNSVH